MTDLTPAAQRRFCVRESPQLSHSELVGIGRKLIELGHSDAIRYSSNGARINIDTLPDEHIQILYDAIKAP